MIGLSVVELFGAMDRWEMAGADFGSYVDSVVQTSSSGPESGRLEKLLGVTSSRVHCYKLCIHVMMNGVSWH